MRRLLLLTLLVVLTAAGTAHASGADVARDCNDNGRLDATYPQRDLRSALANLPADLDQYSNCRRIIKQAQLAALSGSGTSDPGSGTGTPPGGSGTGPGGTGTPGTGGGVPDPGSTSAPGDFGGFEDVPVDPLADATQEEARQLTEARAVAPPGLDRTASISTEDIPAPLWAVLAVAAIGLLILGATDLRRRVVARRAG